MSQSLAVAQPSSPALSVERARDILAECKSVDEVKDVRDKAEAITRYLRSQKASAEAQMDAAEISLRATRRLGELVREMPKAGGSKGQLRGRSSGGRIVGPPEEKAPTFADRGIDKRDAHRWQKLAEVPVPRFEEHIGEVRRRAEKLTVSGTIRACAPSKPKRTARRSLQGGGSPVRMVRDRGAEVYDEPWTEPEEAEYASEGSGSRRGRAIASQVRTLVLHHAREWPAGEPYEPLISALRELTATFEAREERRAENRA